MRCAYKYVYILLGFLLPTLAWYFIISLNEKKKKDFSYIVMNLAEVELL